MKIPSLLLTAFVLAPLAVSASGSFNLAWKELRFTNESGDIVEISQKEGKDKLRSLRICWSGWYFDLPRAAIADVPSPLLNDVDLGYSAGIRDDGSIDHSMVLELPIFSTDSNSPKRRYVFSFHAGKFMTRHLEEIRGTSSKRLESVSFDLPGEYVADLRPGRHGKLICRPGPD